jgi:hypothetical protein
MARSTGGYLPQTHEFFIVEMHLRDILGSKRARSTGAMTKRFSLGWEYVADRILSSIAGPVAWEPRL